MTIRTARRGANAGNRFYGCSNFPACRATRSLDSDPDESDNTQQEAVGFEARSIHYDRTDGLTWETLYTIGGGRLRSSSFIQKTLASEASSVRARLEQAFIAVTPPDEPTTDPATRQVVGTFRKILQRGDRPPLDPEVEWELLRSVGIDSRMSPDDPGDLAFSIIDPGWLDQRAVLDALSHSAASFEAREDLRFDSDEERMFVRLVSEQLGPHVARWLYPQVDFSTLTKDPTDSRRLDFLFSPPWGNPTGVEIDGMQHRQAVGVDEDRDELLSQLGIGVVRIPASSIRAGNLADFVRVAKTPTPKPIDRRLQSLIHGPAFGTRLGLALAEAVERGWLEGAGTWTIRIEDPLGVAPIVLPSLLELFAAIDELWAGYLAPTQCVAIIGNRTLAFERTGVAQYQPLELQPSEASVTIILDPDHSPIDALPSTDGPTIVLRASTLPTLLADRRGEGSQLAIAKDPAAVEESLERVLRYVFAKKSFREGQLQGLGQVLRRRDSLILLPTGAGKSLIYQMAGLLLPGRTLVIDPIIALMEDQVESLKRAGIDRAVGISSFTAQQGLAEKALAMVQSGDALFFFVAPERLQQRGFRSALQALTVSTPINAAVVDEAHCISEWGHDFRPAYLNLGPVLRRVCAAPDGSAPPILALTGTASRAVLRDVLIELDLDRSDPNGIVKPASFNRPELSFSVLPADQGASEARLIGLLLAMPDRLNAPNLYRQGGGWNDLGIVFCPHVNGKNGVVHVAGAVRMGVTPRVEHYSGTAPNGFDPKAWQYRKREVADKFREGEVSILCATKAFGMGVDIPNVRFTVHYGIPGSIEAFYQEAGRAGRDRRPSHCAVVFYEIDPRLSETLLTDSTDGEQVRLLFEQRQNGNRDDILNQLWFHFRTFKGREVEERAIRALVAATDWDGTARTVQVPFDRTEDGQSAQERAILRLHQVGMVTDYLKEWGSRQFELTLAEASTEDLAQAFLRFVVRAQPARLDERREAVAKLPNSQPPAQRATDLALMAMDMIYDTVEKSRRRALREMRLLAAESPADNDIRRRIEDYFREGDLAPQLEGLLEATKVNLPAWYAIFGTLSLTDEGELRGSAGRLLESYPDHPGLLLGRAFAELMSGSNQFEFRDNLTRALSFGRDRYALDPADLSSIVEFTLERASVFRPLWRPLIWQAWEEAFGVSDLLPFETKTLTDPATSPGESVVLLSRALGRALESAQQLSAQFAGKEPE
jgi:ATP-dependent DNA helicase RecQ